MKKITLFSLVVFCGGLFFNSCSSNLTIVKRHYKPGYYVSTGKTRTQPTQTVSAADKPEAPAAVNPDSVKGSSIQSSSDVAVNRVRVTQVKALHKTMPHLKKGIAPLLPSKQHANDFKASHKKAVTFKKSEQTASDSEGLSLFWIVILLIILLWALGYAGGLGSLINLLLLVALILLILWLLRVI
jgi:hypothetical protein